VAKWRETKAGVKACVQYGGKNIRNYITVLSVLGIVLFMCIFANCICLACVVVPYEYLWYLMCICCTLCLFIILCVYCCSYFRCRNVG
jgi:bacteriorhodopsin